MSAAPTPASIGEEAFKIWCRTLQLDARDARQSAWLDRVAGMASGGHISLSTPPCAIRSAVDSEPKTSIRCQCSRVFDLPTYLVEFVERHRAALPSCPKCKCSP